MTKNEWLNYANAHRAVLISIISKYHPVNRQPGTRHSNKTNNYHGDFITAPNAEAACVQVRKNIRENFEGNPQEQFEDALSVQDWKKINKLLNDTWFGVPESFSCWGITGFRELVHLVEEIPDDVE